MKPFIAALALMTALTGCGQAASAPETSRPQPAPSAPATSTAAATTTTVPPTTTTTTTRPLSPSPVPPKVCGLDDDEIRTLPAAEVEGLQTEVGTTADAAWGPKSATARDEYCSPFREAEGLRPPLVTVEAYEYGYHIRRNIAVRGSDFYQFRYGQSKPLDNRPIYALDGKTTRIHSGTGGTYVQVRSCVADTGCGTWSAPFYVNAGNPPPPKKPVRTTKVTSTTQSLRYQCDYLAARFEDAIEAEAYEYATGILETFYDLGCT